MAGKMLLGTHGQIHYELSGPPDGELVILIHGFSTPYFVWDHTVPALLEAGFRVLRYDLYGRGQSAKPDAIYNIDFFVRQLLELLHALNLRGPYHLCGVSMGGAIAASFAQTQRHDIRRMALISPAGVAQRAPFGYHLAQIPGLGTFLMRAIGDLFLRASLKKNLAKAENFPDLYKRYQPQIQDPGFIPALVSTLKHLPLFGMEDTYRNISEDKHPTLIIWGDQDQITPYSNSKLLCQFMPHATLLTIPGGGHISHFEEPQHVNPPLVAFLQASSD